MSKKINVKGIHATYYFKNDLRMYPGSKSKISNYFESQKKLRYSLLTQCA